MKRLGQTVVKNAIANVVRGGATAVVALALPHFLTHTLDRDHFAAWVLMLQIAAYASYLDFGLQTAVARYLAQAIERRDDVLRDQLISTAFAMLCAGGALALTVIGIVIWQLPHLFHGAPPALLGQLRGGVAVLAIAAAIQLPLSTFTGVLIGLHRNEYPALAIGGSRILGALAVIAAARHTHSLLLLAACIALTNLVGAIIQYAVATHLLSAMRIKLLLVSRLMISELVGYCAALSIWSVGMLIISGLDVTIVASVHFDQVGDYALAATLITFFTGLNGAACAALITPLAVLEATQNHDQIRLLVLSTTRLSTYVNVLLVITTVALGAPLLRVWIGENYAAKTLPILEVLLIGQAIRLIGSSYATALVATGKQKYALSTVMIESSSNLLFSLFGVAWLGALGVAWGTLFAALLGVVSLIRHTMPRVRSIALQPSTFVQEGILRPLLCLSPMVLYAWCTWAFSAHPIWLLLPVAALCTLLLIWNYGKLCIKATGS